VRSHSRGPVNRPRVLQLAGAFFSVGELADEHRSVARGDRAGTDFAARFRAVPAREEGFAGQHRGGPVFAGRRGEASREGGVADRRRSVPGGHRAGGVFAGWFRAVPAREGAIGGEDRGGAVFAPGPGPSRHRRGLCRPALAPLRLVDLVLGVMSLCPGVGTDPAPAPGPPARRGSARHAVHRGGGAGGTVCPGRRLRAQHEQQRGGGQAESRGESRSWAAAGESGDHAVPPEASAVRSTDLIVQARRAHERVRPLWTKDPDAKREGPRGAPALRLPAHRARPHRTDANKCSVRGTL